MAKTNRGKQFICWLPNNKGVNTYALFQGDEVYFELGGEWVLGTIHCFKNTYTFCHAKKKYIVYMTTQLKAKKLKEAGNAD